MNHEQAGQATGILDARDEASKWTADERRRDSQPELSLTPWRTPGRCPDASPRLPGASLS
jgi:hypothetical protein